MRNFNAKLITAMILYALFFTFTPNVKADHQTPSFNFSKDERFDDFYISLDGEWTFFPEEILEPDEISLFRNLSQQVYLPDSFKNQTNKVNTYGTYSTNLAIPEQLVGQALAVHIPYQYSAYKMFINGKEVAQNGQVASSESAHNSEMAPRTGYFVPEEKELQILVQVSSFAHIRGGLENSIYIGAAQQVTNVFNKKIHMSLFLIAALIIMGLFTISLVSFRRDEIVFMIFGLFCLTVAFRALFTDPFYYTLVFPNISWLWGTRLEYILTLASSFLYVLLIKFWYKENFSNYVVWISAIALLPAILITCFSQPVMFQDLFFKLALLAVPIGSYFIFLTFKELQLNNSKARINAFGIIMIFLAFINDFSVGLGLYQFYNLMLPTVAIYVFLHMIQMSFDFSRVAKNKAQLNLELKSLNASLDEEVHKRTLELQRANKKLAEQAMIDSLTNIPNRRSFNSYIEKKFSQAKENKQALSILMLDIDEFKKYNDYFGHTRGDWLLQEVAKIIKRVLPKNSFFARYGGEEFSVILPKRSKEEAFLIAESVRRAIEDRELDHPESKCGILTFSIGVASMSEDSTYKTEIELIDSADKQLYKAKQAGRNQVK